MTELEILQFINDAKDEQGNNIFKASKDVGPVQAGNGTTTNFFRSFYRWVNRDGGNDIQTIKIRAANHRVVMRDWENNGNTPWENKYNIDIVFDNNVQEDADKRCHRFFVIEEYIYRISEMTPKKLQKIINAVLKIGDNGFKDPVKLAHNYVLQPRYMYEPEKKILPPTDGSVHEHQVEVWQACEKKQKGDKTNESLSDRRRILPFDAFCINSSRNINKVYNITETNMIHIKKLNEMMMGDRYYLYKGRYKAYISVKRVVGTTSKPRVFYSFDRALAEAEKLGLDIRFSYGLRDEVQSRYFSDREYGDVPPTLFFDPDKPIEESRRANARGRAVNEAIQGYDIAIIRSYFSDDNDSSDGIFKVVLPDKYLRNYKKVISEVGNVRNDLQAEMINSVDDIRFEPNSVLKREDFEEMWDRLEEYREEGGSLANILDVLGWEWESLECDLFDADYNDFK
ncbi:MAG: hypothetical protein J6T63_08490 [Bacteroidales bacterium]|nr:hypothetical protein [Bacteroidales bacterium]